MKELASLQWKRVSVTHPGARLCLQAARTLSQPGSPTSGS